MEKIKTTIKPEERRFSPMGGDISEKKVELANKRVEMEEEAKVPVHEIMSAEEELLLDEINREDKKALEELRKEFADMTGMEMKVEENSQTMEAAKKLEEMKVAEKSELRSLDNIFVGSNDEVRSALTKKVNEFKAKFRANKEINTEVLRQCLQKALETKDRITAAGANERAEFEKGMDKLIGDMESLAQVASIKADDIRIEHNKKMRPAA